MYLKPVVSALVPDLLLRGSFPFPVAQLTSEIPCRLLKIIDWLGTSTTEN